MKLVYQWISSSLLPVLHCLRETCHGHSPYSAFSPFTIFPRRFSCFHRCPVLVIPPIFLPLLGLAWMDRKVSFSQGVRPQASLNVMSCSGFSVEDSLVGCVVCSGSEGFVQPGSSPTSLLECH